MEQNRRDFFKSLALGLGTVAAASQVSILAQAQGRKRGGAEGDVVLAVPGTGQAASINYVHKTSDIKDAALKTERQGVKFENQNCANCALYVKHGMLGGEEVGKCTILVNKNEVVKASGWCMTWSKKA